MKENKTRIYTVVPRINGTPMPSHISFAIALAKLANTNKPTVIAYPITKAPCDNFMYDMTVTPLQCDFACWEDDNWHLTDDFQIFEETSSISYLDGIIYAGFAERIYQDYLSHSDSVNTNFKWLIDIDTLPVTDNRNNVPNEISSFVKCINKMEKVGTPLFPYITCSVSRTQTALMHGRYSLEPKKSESAHISSYSNNNQSNNKTKVEWRWDLYDYLIVLVDSDGKEVLEFDEDQMLVRFLPRGRPVTTFNYKQSIANRVADSRGIQYEGTLDALMKKRHEGMDKQLYVDYLNWYGMRWTHQGNLYVLRDVNDNALIGMDLEKMRIYTADGTFADCVGDPGGMFEIALFMTERAKNAINTIDVTGLPVKKVPNNNSVESYSVR